MVHRRHATGTSVVVCLTLSGGSSTRWCYLWPGCPPRRNADLAARLFAVDAPGGSVDVGVFELSPAACAELARTVHLACWPDPTDLWALSVLPLSSWVLTRARSPALHQNPTRPMRTGIALVALVLCTATSPNVQSLPASVESFRTDVYLHSLATQRYLDVALLRYGQQDVCLRMLRGERTEIGDAFDTMQLWTFTAHESLPVLLHGRYGPEIRCHAVLFSAGERTVAVWAEGALPIHAVRRHGEPDAGAIIIDEQGHATAKPPIRLIRPVRR